MLTRPYTLECTQLVLVGELVHRDQLTQFRIAYTILTCRFEAGISSYSVKVRDSQQMMVLYMKEQSMNHISLKIGLDVSAHLYTQSFLVITFGEL